jgi:hypothetical protein
LRSSGFVRPDTDLGRCKVATNEVDDSEQTNVAAVNRPRSSVKSRIEARIRLLDEWFETGIPAGRRSAIPTSLTQLRKWELVEHGIEPIRSPNEFTLTHPVVGGFVQRAERSMRRLLQKYPSSGRPTPNRDVSVASQGPRPDYEGLASLYHMERDKRLAAESRANLAEQKCRDLEEELAALRRIISQDATARKLRVIP